MLKENDKCRFFKGVEGQETILEQYMHLGNFFWIKIERLCRITVKTVSKVHESVRENEECRICQSGAISNFEFL